MSTVVIKGSAVSTPLLELLKSDEIVPGAAPSYTLCKTIYSYHPLGKKMVDSPISMAQSQSREISIPDSPEDDVRDQFLREWKAIGADAHIYNTGRLARMYGVSAVAILIDGVPPSEPPDYEKLARQAISFNVLDALNLAGSIAIQNQDPNAMGFNATTTVNVNGVHYNRARTCVMMNEDPLYIEYTSSGFGYVGRSVYQRALFPMKTYIQSMITDDMVTRKAGLLVAMMKQAGSIIDNVMARFAAVKRSLLKEAETDNVLSIGSDDKIESLDMQNVDGPASMARKNVLENIAVSADMPAKLINNETFAEGFGEGTEDAKNIAGFVDGIRTWLSPLYDYFDKVVMYRAWNEEFYATIQTKYPEEYGKMDYKTAFIQWRNSFTAIWPSLLREPESELIKVEDTKLQAIIALVETLYPMLDPENKAALVDWAAQNFNDQKRLFQSTLLLDIEALKSYVPPEPVQTEKVSTGRSFADSASRNSYRRRADRGFNEGDHPRERSGENAGQFTSGGGSGKASSPKEAKEKSGRLLGSSKAKGALAQVASTIKTKVRDPEVVKAALGGAVNLAISQFWIGHTDFDAAIISECVNHVEGAIHLTKSQAREALIKTVDALIGAHKRRAVMADADRDEDEEAEFLKALEALRKALQKDKDE